MSRKRKYDDDGYGDEHENDDEEKVWGRVLSIQSHTVHGYVGNKSAGEFQNTVSKLRPLKF